MSTILYFPEQPRPLLVKDISENWVRILETIWNNNPAGVMSAQAIMRTSGLRVAPCGLALLVMQSEGLITDSPEPLWRYGITEKGRFIILSLVATGRSHGFKVRPHICDGHTTRDQAMSCPRYFDGTHGANHFDIASDSAKDSAPLLSCVRAGLDGFIARVDEILDRETAPAEPQDTIEIFNSNGRQI